MVVRARYLEESVRCALSRSMVGSNSLAQALEGDIGDAAPPPSPRKIRQSLLKCLSSDP